MGRRCRGRSECRGRSGTIVSASQPHPQLLGVVLCGGQSKRMGRDKASLSCPASPSSGQSPAVDEDLPRTFLTHAVDRLRGLCGQIAVSGHCSVAHRQVVIRDDVDHQGPIHGVLASLRFAKQQGLAGCLMTPVDMPHLDGDDLGRVIQAWEASSVLTVAVSDRIEPLVAIYPTAIVDDLKSYLDRGDRSLMRWIQSIDHQSVVLSDRSCHNVNTPSDLPFN